MSHDYHVIAGRIGRHTRGIWAVKKTNGKIATFVTRGKYWAIQFAAYRAKRDQCAVYIHDRAGRVQKVYGLARKRVVAS